MLNNFAYLKAGSLAEAVKALSAEGTVLHAGGTDLMGCLREEIIRPEKVISISGISELKGISAGNGGSLKIGALTTLAAIASDKTVLETYSVLAQAAASAASPQLRNQGTVGGNLCQRPRCWYFRSDLQCRKKGGGTCYAMGGENQYHAIFGGGPCFFVHPSDTAVALAALDAGIKISGPGGNKTIKTADFFISPRQMVTKENILLSNEVITEIILPPMGENTRSAYRKIRARAAWDFALTSVAAVIQLNGSTVQNARIVLGGVAPYPWRVSKAEEMIAGKTLNAAGAAAAAEAALDGASPLRDNRFKLEIVKGAVEETLLELAG
ncbi:MAG: xanthine dehydrogenase family protein subunit M [Acidobacteriota bacterium]